MKTREEILEEMARIKETDSYKKFQAKHEENVKKHQALVSKFESKKMGTTADGKHEVWAPVAGPDRAKVSHLLSNTKYWMCAYCRATFRFRGHMFKREVFPNADGSFRIVDRKLGPQAIVDFDGKVYHIHCYEEMERQKPPALPEKEETKEMELKELSELGKGKKRALRLYITARGCKELDNMEWGSEKWWQRISDHTQVSPEWLRENVDPEEVYSLLPLSSEDIGTFELDGFVGRLGVLAED